MGVLTVAINEEIMARGTWQNVLKLASERCEAMDELNCVTALHRSAKLYRDEDNNQTPLRDFHRNDGFLRLLEVLEHFSCRCRPQQLSNAIWSFAVLLWKDEGLLQRLCELAVIRLGGFVPQNVANTIWALATLGFAHEGILALLPRYVDINVKDFSPQDLANTCWAMARLQRQCEPLFQVIVAESLVKLHTFQPQNMSNLVWSCATVLYKDEEGMHKIAAHAALRVDRFSPQELSNLTWGMATLGILSHAWMEASSLEMKSRQTDCCPQDLSNTLWSYGTLVYKPTEVIRSLNWEVMRQIEWFSPQGLANVTWGLSAIEYRDVKTLTCISEEVIRRPLEQMTPPDTSTLLYSFAVLGWTHPGALRKLRRLVRFGLPVFASRDVANCSWALVILSHRDDDLFRKLTRRASDMIPDFTITGLCNIAWAFVRFGIDVPQDVVHGIALETVKRRDEFDDEPGDALLLSDAVCYEWIDRVPRSLVDACDAIGRERFEPVAAFLSDWANIPAIGSASSEIERYQRAVEGFKIIQLGRRLTTELLHRWGILQESLDSILELRRQRESWLLQEIAKADPTDAQMQHKTIGAWALCLSSSGDVPIEIVASGSPMEAPIRFAPCVVEHSRASDAEFQVVNRAAERLLNSAGLQDFATEGFLRMDVGEIPCLSCLGALRQFQRSFRKVRVCLSFNVRKVCDIFSDHSEIVDMEGNRELANAPPPRAHLEAAPPSVPNNRRPAINDRSGKSAGGGFGRLSYRVGQQEGSQLVDAVRSVDVAKEEAIRATAHVRSASACRAQHIDEPASCKGSPRSSVQSFY